MSLTPEQKEIGRRNFLRAVAGTPALAALAAATAAEGPRRGGPVKTALVGAGGEGRVLLGQCRKGWVDVRAICDINPKHGDAAADSLAKSHPRPRVYQDLKTMLEKEDLEAVVVATPLWTHADIAVACLQAGKHVLCEKMMAYDAAGCDRMLVAARENQRLLEIGHQRFYNSVYQAAYEGIVRSGQLGDVFVIRAVWHRNGSWRRDEKPPSPDFDPRPWGYASWEHLVNWRLYRKHSHGLMAELGSHQIAVADWFFGAGAKAVYTSGGIHRYKDGREVNDHVYATFEYPGGRTATFTSIQSNKFDGNYEQIMGTKGTLVLSGEKEAFFFPEQEARATAIEVSPLAGDVVMDASESRVADARGRTVDAAAAKRTPGPLDAYRNEITAFCSAIRAGTPLACGPERARASAVACITANLAADEQRRLDVG